MSDRLDAVAASPEHHEVLLENDRVRVLETLIRPGEETAAHTHVWGGYLYILSWSDCIRYEDQREAVMNSRQAGFSPRAGTAVWAAPLPPHSLRDVGQQNLHVILTEFEP